MTPLIDATEMYLRTVWELHEEGVPALRARLVERLGVSAPAVSETVNRLADEGLVELDAKRQVQLTAAGRHLAAGVMRKHRLAERLLTDVIGLDTQFVHNEACRWEHVISDRVEQRLIELLGDPGTSPFGNPIPEGDDAVVWSNLVTARTAAADSTTGTISRISEQLQTAEDVMLQLGDAGIRPGMSARAEVDGSNVVLTTEAGSVRLDRGQAEMVWLTPTT